MKLKNKYSKQIIYSNQKFEDQIWYNQQIFQENTFLKTKPNFPLTGKCFSLTNFSNGKQTQESLESDFPETTFQKTNTAKRENTFPETKPNFSLTGKCFPLTGKCFRWPESVFRWPIFLIANKHKKVWKIISWKLLFRVIEYFPLEIFNGYFPSVLWLEITNEICYLTNSVDI